MTEKKGEKGLAAGTSNEPLLNIKLKPRCKPGFHLFNTEGNCCLCPAQLDESKTS